MSKFFNECFSYAFYIVGGLAAGTILGITLFYIVEFLKGLGI